MHFSRRPVGYTGSLVIGAGFAAGWTPCVGPVLGTMLLYASITDTVMDGVTLLAFYSFGLGVPLFATSLVVPRFIGALRSLRVYVGLLSRVGGLLLIAVGMLMYTDSIGGLTALFERYGIGFYLGFDGGDESYTQLRLTE